MKCKDFIGNAEAFHEVLTSIETGDIAHATMFLGPKGVGKKYLGRMLGQAILCEGEEKPCGHCHPCELLMAGNKFGENHPDYFEVYPEGRSIKKAVIEDLIYSAQTKAYLGREKVFLIEDFDRVTKEGQNALLKTLEEPLSGVYFILLSSFEDKILPTIHSRCRVIQCQSIPQNVIEDALVDQGLDPAVAREAALLSGGSYSRAMLHSREDISNSRRQELLDAFFKLGLVGGFEAFRTWKVVEKYLENLEEVFYLLESWSRDLMIYYLMEDQKLLCHKDRLGDIIRVSDRIQDRCLGIYEKVIKTREYIEANGNKQLLFEELFIYIGG